MKLFEPAKIGELSIINRIIMAPIGIGTLNEPDGRLSQRAIDYYVARAKGGVGLIMTGATCVDNEVEKKTENGFGMLPRADSVIHLGRFSELADALHDYGAKLCVQLTAGLGRVTFSEHMLRRGLAIAPSALPCFRDPRVIAKELTTEEVEKLVQAFRRAAYFLGVAGVDAIELHGHEGYLFDQFQSAIWNKRKDKYGGDFEERLRFPLEVIEVIKAELGEDFPVIYQYGIFHYIDGGREADESLEMAKCFEQAGADALHVDAGCYETWYWAHPPIYQPRGCMVDLAKMVKEVVDIPIIAVGKLGDPEFAEKVLQEGSADFVSLGRPLLADPEWPIKVKEGRFDDIRPCIGDHACLTRILNGQYTSCAVNPATGMEREFTLQRAQQPKSVLVIGGGPAGMEAARVAAERGHKVSLWEKNDELGGTLIAASVPEFKSDLGDLIRYLSTQINKLGVDVRLCKEAELESVEAMKPDVVIVATGATPIIPKIPGIGKEKVATAIDLLLGKKESAETVLVIGGGLIGCETALYLAQKSKEVTVIEILQGVLQGENTANRQQMLKMLADSDVKILTNASVLEITDTGAIISHNEKQEELSAETIALAVGLEPSSTLRDELEDKVPEVYAAGNCIQARRVLEAIWEGFRIARLI